MFVTLFAFPWFTTTSLTVELVVRLAQSFTFVAPVSLTVKLAQALSFVTLDHVLLPILSHDQQDRAHRVLLLNVRHAVRLPVVHIHDPQGGVRGEARRHPCVPHGEARSSPQVRPLLPHHVPDVSVLSTGYVSSFESLQV